MEEFKEGEIVQLKSGGPKMTVAKPEVFEMMGEGRQDNIVCQWFSGSKLSRGSFSKEVLVKVVDDKKVDDKKKV